MCEGSDGLRTNLRRWRIWEAIQMLSRDDVRPIFFLTYLEDFEVLIVRRLDLEEDFERRKRLVLQLL